MTQRTLVRSFSRGRAPFEPCPLVNRELVLSVDWASWLFGAQVESFASERAVRVHLGPLSCSAWWERR